MACRNLLLFGLVFLCALLAHSAPRRRGRSPHLVKQIHALSTANSDLRDELAFLTVYSPEQRKRAEAEAIAVAEKRKIAELEAEKISNEANLFQRKEEEKRKTSQLETEQVLLRLSVEKEQAINQTRFEDKVHRQRNLDLVKLQEASALKQDALRLKTELQIQEAKRKTDAEVALVKAEAETAGKIRQERENEDVTTRQIRAKSIEERVRMKQMIQTVFDNLGRSFNELLFNRTKLLTVVGALAALILSGYFAKETAVLARRQVEQRMGKPSLVRDTSRSQSTLTRFLGWLRLSLWPSEDHFKGVILTPDLMQQVRRLAVATRNAKRNRAPLRHLMLYGPPGTGKTMVARRLARHCGLDYAIMNGSDVAPLGKEAVTELHKLFAWARGTRKGVILFIDEADAFLGSRSRQGMSEDMRNALSALLYQTGVQTAKFMMIMATNRPGDLDAAVVDRLDQSLYFGKPLQPQREQLVSHYFGQYIVSRAASVTPGPGQSRRRRGRSDTGETVEETEDEGSATDDATTVSGGSGTEYEEEDTVGGATDDDGEDGSNTDEEEDGDDGVRVRSGRGGNRRRGARQRRVGAAPSSLASTVDSDDSDSEAEGEVVLRRRAGDHDVASLAHGCGAKLRTGSWLLAPFWRLLPGPAPLYVRGVTPRHLREVAKRLRGLSGREIAKTLLAVQGELYGTEARTLSPMLLQTVVDRGLKRHRRKQRMRQRGTVWS